MRIIHLIQRLLPRSYMRENARQTLCSHFLRYGGCYYGGQEDARESCDGKGENRLVVLVPLCRAKAELDELEPRHFCRTTEPTHVFSICV